MLAKSAIVGMKYLSKNGTPVTVVEFKDDKVILFSEITKMKIPVSQNYPLKAYEGTRSPLDTDPMREKVNALMSSVSTQTPISTVKSKPRGETLASIIDPYLFEGNKTVAEIVKAIERRKLPITEGKELSSNIRARMVAYSRKGWKVEKSKDKKVKVTEPGK